MNAGEHYEQGEEGKMAYRWNQVAGMMNSLRWGSESVGWNLKRGKKKDIEGQRGGWGLDNCLSFG